MRRKCLALVDFSSLSLPAFSQRCPVAADPETRAFYPGICPPYSSGKGHELCYNVYGVGMGGGAGGGGGRGVGGGVCVGGGIGEQKCQGQ